MTSKKQISKMTSSRLPWVAAAIIVVAAAAGAWAMLGGAPAATPPAGTARVSATLGSGTVFAAPPDNSGIENIYIVKVNQTYTENFSGLTDNYLGVISSNGGSVNIPYDTKFAIVVAVTAHKNNTGQLTAAYMKVALGATAQSGDWLIPYENSDDNATYIHEYTFYPADGTKIRFNVLWDNDNNFYKLKADDNLVISAVNLWLRGPVP